MDIDIDFVFLTVTLNPKIWGTSSLYEQFKESRFVIFKFLRQFATDYEAWPELHKSGAVHWHIMYKEKDRIKRHRLTKQMVDILGFCDFQIPKDLQACKEYCSKNEKDMELLFLQLFPIDQNCEEHNYQFEKKRKQREKHKSKFRGYLPGPLDDYFNDQFALKITSPIKKLKVKDVVNLFDN